MGSFVLNTSGSRDPRLKHCGLQPIEHLGRIPPEISNVLLIDPRRELWTVSLVRITITKLKTPPRTITTSLWPSRQHQMLSFKNLQKNLKTMKTCFQRYLERHPLRFLVIIIHIKFWIPVCLHFCENFLFTFF